MSEFEHCGTLMFRNKEGKLECPICGSNRPSSMDGKSNAELRAEEEYENEEEEEN